MYSLGLKMHEKEYNMGIFDLFSKRLARRKGDVSDVLVEGPLPQKLKIQIVHILQETIGIHGHMYSSVNDAYTIYSNIRQILLKEYGKFNLNGKGENEPEDLLNWFLNKASDLEALDTIEICFSFIYSECDDFYKRNHGTIMTNEQAITELNKRFLESNIGYQFNTNQLFPLKEQFTHQNATLPALQILSNKRFKGAEEEFRKAYSHYKESKYEESIVDSLKSFESMMMNICAAKDWEYDKKDSASKLIKTMINNGLIVPELQAPLESGLPTIRNKLGGHGKGNSNRTVPKHVAMYALNLAANNILLLGEAYQNLR